MGDLIPLQIRRRYDSEQNPRRVSRRYAPGAPAGGRSALPRSRSGGAGDRWRAADPFIAAGATLGFTAATAFMAGAVMVAGGFFAAGAAAISLSTAMAWGSFEVSAYRPRRLREDPFGAGFAESAGDAPPSCRDRAGREG